MIPGSAFAKVAAVLIACGMHVALAAALVRPAPIEVEGAGGTAEVQLGTAFQDLVEGNVLASKTPDARPLKPLEVTQKTLAEPATAAMPTKLDALEHAKPVPAKQPQSAKPTDHARALVAANPEDVAALSQTAAPLMKAEERSSGLKVQTPAAIKAEPAPPLSAHAAPQAIAALKERVFAPQQSQRPAERPQRTTARSKTRKSGNVRPASNAGNANQNARAGSQDARANGAAVTSGASRTRQATGNAAASSYPGKVMRCISRAARLNRNRSGTAVVTFRVDAAGRVGSVALSASSGDTRLDRAAVRAISRAGPCPSPPQGAQTRFSIRIE